MAFCTVCRCTRPDHLWKYHNEGDNGIKWDDKFSFGLSAGRKGTYIFLSTKYDHWHRKMIYLEENVTGSWATERWWSFGSCKNSRKVCCLLILLLSENLWILMFFNKELLRNDGNLRAYCTTCHNELCTCCFNIINKVGFLIKKLICLLCFWTNKKTCTIWLLHIYLCVQGYIRC